MIHEDEYCIDIIKQGQAVQAAIAKVNEIMLGNHIETCVTTAIRSDDRLERERVIRELMEVYRVAGKT
jgi:DNA-binding FrmR family transcriptional regulator